MMMTYLNKDGEAFLISNYQAIEIFDLPNKQHDIVLFPIHSDHSYDIENIEGESEGTPTEFIEWIVLMVEAEKWKVTWKDYLEYREKVLPAMKEVDEKD